MGAKQKKQIARLQEKVRQCERYKDEAANAIVLRRDNTCLSERLREANQSLEKERRELTRLDGFISEAIGGRIRIDKDAAMRMRYDIMRISMDFCPRMLEYNLGGDRMQSLTHAANMISHQIERQVFNTIMKELAGSSLDNRMAGIY